MSRIPLAFLLSILAGPAMPQYPARHIELIVPVAAGGGLDLQARMLAELAEKELGQRIVVMNRPGAGETIGVHALTQAKPDGYTLAAVWAGPLTASPHNQPVQYSPDDYAPVVLFSKAPFVVCVAPDFPAATGAQLVARLKAEPDKYTYGNEGAGGTLHLGLERISAALGVSARAVPFAGAADTARNFAGGHITIYAGGIASILPMSKAGRAKCLMMTTAAGNPMFPAAAGLEALPVTKLQSLPTTIEGRLTVALVNAAGLFGTVTNGTVRYLVAVPTDTIPPWFAIHGGRRVRLTINNIAGEYGPEAPTYEVAAMERA